MATLKEMTNEYNELTGRSVKSLANKAQAKRYLELAKKKKVREYSRIRVTVKGVKYNSVREAFRALGFALNHHCVKLRDKLTKQKQATFREVRFSRWN